MLLLHLRLAVDSLGPVRGVRIHILNQEITKQVQLAVYFPPVQNLGTDLEKQTRYTLMLPQIYSFNI